MQLSNSFTIARPVDEVYDAFLDVDRIATCMPGSTLLGRSGADTYDGEVKVKVGPLNVVYTGQVTILDRDPASHTLTMRAKGREKRGAGNADAYVVATMTEDDGATTVTLDTELNIRGKVAQFGRGVIADVSDSIMQTFAGNVEQLLGSGAPADTPAGGPSTDRRPAPPEPTTDAPEPTAAAADAGSGDGLDAWSLIVKPMLQRYAAPAVTVALAGVAAYLGARRGARAARRRHRPDSD